MRAIAHAHASTLVTNLMHAKNSTRRFCSWHSLSETLEWRKWNKDQKLQIEEFIIFIQPLERALWFKIFESMKVISLYWFAAEQQSSTFER